MRWATVVLVIAFLLAAPYAAMADSGRAAPNCVNVQAANLQPTVEVDPDACLIIDLGLLTPGDVYDMSVVIVNDAIDLLFFDENGIQPYELGQSYRSSMAQPASTEFALGGYEFHWEVPPSIAAKRWYMVLDNQGHDGDAGQGDQGGLKSTISVSVDLLDQAYWTPFNNLVAVDTGSFDVLLSGDELRLDAGTTVVLSAWDLEFTGDVYLQTRTMHDRYVSGGIGVQYLDGGALQGIESPQSLTWQVPSSLDGEELLLIVDNTDSPLGGGDGTAPLRMTVRLELSPPLTPVISDDSEGTVSIGQVLTLDASATPNRLGQRGDFSWDLDETSDTNGDGNDINDNDAQGLSVSASWNTPGQKTVHAMMTSPSGQTATTSYQVTVVDTEAPVPRIQTDATPVASGWRVDVGTPLIMNCDASSDDDVVSQCTWTIDGAASGNGSSLETTWDETGVHTITLTVVDPAGNSAQVNATVRSVDSTLPFFSEGLLSEFPLTATAGESFSLVVGVYDDFDNDDQLRVHWDVNPGKDTDGNGDPKDDADYTGIEPSLTFTSSGKQDIVVTVFDGSNNSNSHAFSIAVASAPDTSSSSMIMAFGAGIVLLFMGLTLVAGYRTWQRRLGFDLLLNRGLNEDEARNHMAAIAQRTSLGLFAKAEDYAGLDQGEVMSQEERNAAQKEAEMQAIYGSSEPVDQTAAFAPPAYASAPLSQASSQAAAEAAALLADSEPTQALTQQSLSATDPLAALLEEPLDSATSSMQAPASLPSEAAIPNAEPSTPVALPREEASPAASVALPVQSEPPMTPPMSTPPPAPAPLPVRHTCSSCGAVFEVDLPAGLSEAIVACPACEVDQHIRADG